MLAPTFKAYLVLQNDRCVAADLRVRWAKKKTTAHLRKEFIDRGWIATIVSRTTVNGPAYP